MDSVISKLAICSKHDVQ